MEPNKRRKLAPKVNATTPSKPPPPPTQFPHESPQQHHPPQEAVPAPLSERHDFESFARHLQDAAMLIQRQTERHPYTDVSVLLLRWEDDESVDEDLTALEQVLQKQYKYRTEKWHIPTVPDLSKKLGVQMASFLEHAKPNHLLIIYYAGHGYVSSDGQLFWACNTREDAAKLKWDGVRCLFEDAQSDILLLLDTCAVPDPPMAGSHGVKQAIAARASDRSPDSLERSFTSNLTEALQKLSSGRPFTTQRLHEEVLFLKKQQQLLQTPRQTNGSTSNTQSSPQNPVFIPLTPGKGQSIALAPMPSRPRTGSQNGHDADGQGNREEQLIDPESVVDLRFEEPRVLVCTTFVGDASPDMSFFSQWLHSTPPLGDKIAVEGMFLGPPTMLLISMPHSIWNVVQHDKVCCFLGYISSHNMIHLYHKLVGSSGVKPSAREVEDGRILLEARDHAFSTPARVRREEGPSFHSPATREAPNSVERKDYLPQASPSAPAYANSTGGHSKPKDEVEDSAEMQEAAEQLKALSHVRHPSDDITNINRPRTILPDGLPEIRPEGDNDEHGNNDPLATLRNANATVKPPRRALAKGDSKLQSEWEAHVKEMQVSCLVQRRLPPQRSACPKQGCQSVFEGPSSWDEWTEHVGRHMEKGEGGGRLGVDGLLAQWALDEGIIERKTDGEYRLSTSNGISGGGNSGGMPPAFEQKESTLTSVSTLEPSQPEDSLIVETNAKPPEDRMEVDTPE
ncbi:hypothetical protein HG531_007494 [Fusarium graminearum]|nr:hypothetical protein HG531_007494 [Fusarium graminearum]